jgi:hypothetical protein
MGVELEAAGFIILIFIVVGDEAGILDLDMGFTEFILQLEN